MVNPPFEFDYIFYALVFLGVQSLSRGPVEQMHERRIRLQPDLVARIELMPLAEHSDDLFAAELGEDLGLRAGRLDHDNLGFGAVIGDGEMFGPHAIDGGLAFGIGWCRLERQLDAVRTFEGGAAVRFDLAFEEI